MSETIQQYLLVLTEFPTKWYGTNTMIVDKRLPSTQENQNCYHYFLVYGQIQDKHIPSPRYRRLSNLTQLELVSSDHSLDLNCLFRGCGEIAYMHV